MKPGSTSAATTEFAHRRPSAAAKKSEAVSRARAEKGAEPDWFSFGRDVRASLGRRRGVPFRLRVVREAPACGLGGRVRRKNLPWDGEGLEVVLTEPSRRLAVRRVALTNLNVKRKREKKSRGGRIAGRIIRGVCCSPSGRESLPPQK